MSYFDEENEYLYIDGVEVTFDDDSDADDKATDNPQSAVLYNELREAVLRNQANIIPKIQAAVKRFPAIPAFKNFLAVAYLQKGDEKKSDEWLDITLEQHPTYLFGILQKCNRDMRKTVETDIVDKYFSGEPDSIKQLAPNRNRFHVAEMESFYRLQALYYTLKRNQTKVLLVFEKMHTVGITEKVAEAFTTLLFSLTFDMNSKRFDRLQEKNVMQDGRFMADDIQTEEAPVFQHAEVQALFEHDLRSVRKILGEILTLPKESLIADLRLMLRDAVCRFTFYCNQPIQGSVHHLTIALLLLEELDAAEALEDILWLLEQGDAFIKYWAYGDSEVLFAPMLAKLGANRWDIFSEFMQKEEIYAFNKANVSQAIAYTVQHNPDKKAEAVEWFSRSLRYLIDHSDNELLLDRTLLACMAGDIGDFGGKELLPLLQEVYEKDLADEQMAGNWEEVSKELEMGKYGKIIKQARSIEQRMSFVTQEEKSFTYPSQSLDYLKDVLARNKDHLYLSFWEEKAKERVSKPAFGRNDKVSVKYKDGTIVKGVKYKKVEEEIKKGKCVVL